METVGVVGLGYVGLSSAVCLAKRMKVIGLDIDRRKTRALREGETVIHEDGLEQLLRSGLKTGNLTFTDAYGDLSEVKILLLSVGTPSLRTGAIDLQQVESAAAALALVMKTSDGYPLLVVRSTVVPGTTRRIARIIQERTGRRAGKGFGVCCNPEFLREGSAIKDTLHPNRIVIGSDYPRATRKLSAFYRRFYGKVTPPIVETNPDTAELVKYASNSFLATKISFINLIARICEKLPASDVDVVAQSMGLDPRIGGLFLEAGPGYGGSCFPKDMKALIAYADSLGLDTSLLRAVDEINETQPEHLISLAEKNFGDLGTTVAVLGTSFKSGTDDIRESRAVKLIRTLDSRGMKVRAYDPRALETTKRALGFRVTYCSSALECITGSDLVFIMNAEPEFRRLKAKDFSRLMRRPAVFDTRRITDPTEFDGNVSIFYVGRGKPTA